MAVTLGSQSECLRDVPRTCQPALRQRVRSLGVPRTQDQALAGARRSMLSASRALRMPMTSARMCAGSAFFVWYIWASSLSSIRLPFVWDGMGPAPARSLEQNLLPVGADDN
jgi:hypothetical protein